MAEIIFLKGWVDERGGVWVKGMTMQALPEFAAQLVAQGVAKYTEEPKPVKPVSKRISAKDED